jgi:hypothetical protein
MPAHERMARLFIWGAENRGGMHGRHQHGQADLIQSIAVLLAHF